MGSRRCRAYDDRDRSAGDREGEADEESPVRENAEETEDDLGDAPGKALRGRPEGHRGREDHEGAGRDAQEEPRSPEGSAVVAADREEEEVPEADEDPADEPEDERDRGPAVPRGP